MKATKRILVVDDDIDVINIVETILKNEDYEIVTANGKKEALQKAKDQKFDLAICDVIMSTQFEGFELATELTTNPEFGEVKVLMQTSINVFTSPDEDTMRFARNYRAEMKSDEFDVILVQDKESGNAGIDYKNEKGEIVWLPINGFSPKPVTAKKLIEAVRRVL